MFVCVLFHLRSRKAGAESGVYGKVREGVPRPDWLRPRGVKV